LTRQATTRWRKALDWSKWAVVRCLGTGRWGGDDRLATGIMFLSFSPCAQVCGATILGGCDSRSSESSIAGALASSRWLIQDEPIPLRLKNMFHTCLVCLVLVLFASGVWSGTFTSPKSTEKWAEQR
jgi:hypothetical protein